jgi:prolipoprotein diacylglyceryl transferase
MTPTAAGMTLHAYIPSPSQGVWHVGPIPLRAYAFCIIIGIIVAVWVLDRRWRARGGHSDTVNQVATWAVPFGLVGGRLYHLATDPELYFVHGRNWVRAFYVWDGGLGIWGAIALGAVGAYIGCRRAKASFPALADCLAPGLAFAQAIGRWGNYFNQELFGKPTTMPWGLRIDASHAANANLPAGIYHPTFLYESLWDVGTGLIVLWAYRRFRMGHGRAFLLYVMLYVAGRSWIEYLRVDHANHILGLRLNDWTCMLVFAFALITFMVSLYRAPGRETVIEFGRAPAAGASASAEDGRDDASDAASPTAPVAEAVSPATLDSDPVSPATLDSDADVATTAAGRPPPPAEHSPPEGTP